jgi:hypothetical protein
MTLKEKIKKQLDTATPKLNRPFYQAKKCEKIADKFAIEFAEWRLTTLIKNADEYTMKELLEIFKKEKGL